MSASIPSIVRAGGEGGEGGEGDEGGDGGDGGEGFEGYEGGEGGERDPIIVSEGRLFQAAVGGNVSLDCVIENMSPSLVRLWKQGPRVIFAGVMRVRRDMRVSVEDSTGDLVITGVEEGDKGEYECEVETDSDIPVYIRHTLSILHPPTVVRVPKEGLVLAMEGSNISLQCLATGNPRPRVEWVKYKARDKVINQGEVFNISDITPHDDGGYICRASNGVGDSVSERMTLEVTCKY